jgi:hypothetical protein
MILRCAHCRTRFAADDAHRGKTFRCRVCASPIKSDTAEASAPAAEVEEPRPAFAPTVVAAQPSAAVARRKDERSKRDLFGGEVELGAKVVERKDVSPFTAARNENSVLFSLDQLSKPRTGARDDYAPLSIASAGTSSANADGAAKKEDSGLIDLNRMMNDEKLSAKSVRPAPISEAPLGYAREVSHTPVPTVYEANPFSRRKKTGLIAGLAAAAVVALATVGVVASNHEDARLKAAAAAAAAPPPQPVVTAVAAPEPPPAPIAASAPETSKDTDDDKPTSKHRGHTWSKGHKSSRSGAKHGSAPASAPAPKKAADPCGCHGNLLCNMKCSSH